METYLLSLGWGLGDVLCCTPAIRALKQREPASTVFFRTICKGRHHVEYDPPGGAPGSGGAPDEMLWHNPHLEAVLDVDDPPPPSITKTVEMYYVKPNVGPSLDVPLQARYFERLGLPWGPATRFDCDYYLQDQERERAVAVLDQASVTGRFCVLTPRVGWAGKMWHDAGWAHIIERLGRCGWTPVIMAGRRLIGRPWDDGLNLSGTLDIRQTAAILDVCPAMLCTEGGLSHLRFALRRPALVMTCATRYGLQVWAPPELCVEIRNRLDCEPCMWRLGHVEGRPGCPPGNIHDCPEGRSLRDLPGPDVWAYLESHLEAVAP